MCRREIDFIARKDRDGRVAFTDIAAPGFDPEPLGVTWDDLMRRIHGRLPDGKLIEGVEVFRQLYEAIGFSAAVAGSRLPVVSQLLDVAYELFAKNRLRLTGRDATCSVRPGERVSTR